MLDGSFQLRPATDPPPSGSGDTAPPQSEQQWVAARLAEVPPIQQSDFYTLTGRFETLKLILELLAHRQLAQGREPRHLGLDDYVAVLTEGVQGG